MRGGQERYRKVQGEAHIKIKFSTDPYFMLISKKEKGCIIVMEHTIAAISTPNGQGGMGVIRISGETALETADKIFSSISGKRVTEMKGYTASFGQIKDGEEIIDDAVVLVFKAPHSYTGEDVAEISCHGGMYITKRVLRAVLNNGAVPAQAGEFTKRAFLNGKMGLTEAESVMDIISAGGQQSARAALSSLKGRLHNRIDNVKEELLSLAAHLSAWADYPEDEIPEIDDTRLLDGLSKCRSELSNLLKTYDAGKVMREGVDTVIAGRPNVGKSTLMNLLSGCERSIVTNIPGTTRDIIEETVMLGDVPLRLSDTAGIRSTDDPVESIGVQRAKERLLSAGLIFAVFDASMPLSDDDMELLELLHNAPAVAIINKSDLENKIDVDYITGKIPHTVMISAKTGDGADILAYEVGEIVGTSSLDASQGILATERQYSDAKAALKSVEEAIAVLKAGITYDAVTVVIEEAINSLLELTGERVTEAVVDKVFSHFCVGK